MGFLSLAQEAYFGRRDPSHDRHCFLAFLVGSLGFEAPVATLYTRMFDAQEAANGVKLDLAMPHR